MVAKFADDPTLVGLISGKEETHDREEIQQLIGWCSDTNTGKTQEVIVDFRRSRRKEHTPVDIHGEEVERVDNVKFLGIHMTSDRTWSTHTTCNRKHPLSECKGVVAAPHKTGRIWPRW